MSYMDLKGKTVTVVGLGNSGINAARLLAGAGAHVRATDAQDTPSTQAAARALRDNGVETETGGHTEGFIVSSELVVLSPGVEPSSPAVRWAKKAKIPIIGEMELGYRFCKGKIIAITGTNGKSTVTTLIGKMLEASGKDTVICGNIGNSLCGEVGHIKDTAWVVLEVSSFQLEHIELFRPKIALILNITDDHMDRYTKFEDYYNDKRKVFRNQRPDDFLILNRDAGNLRDIARSASPKVLWYSRLEETDGAYFKDGAIYCVIDGMREKICSVADSRLKGLHNIENVLAASLAARLAGAPAGFIKKALKTFGGLSHRFETIAVIDGVEYIDDSKGTTVDSTRRALESCAGQVTLIAGGKDKHSDYGAVRDTVRNKVKHMILIGEASGAIARELAGVCDIRQARDMAEAVIMARSIASRNSQVLLSPMCSSFDMFKSYKERGEVFRKAVFSLRTGQYEAKR